uniref:Uncharacterized protein n=1 Tax=candidate division WOR-3 bacterium TaxID=2052148 RepID=A0A7V0Z3R8_UNCW3
MGENNRRLKLGEEVSSEKRNWAMGEEVSMEFRKWKLGQFFDKNKHQTSKPISSTNADILNSKPASSPKY